MCGAERHGQDFVTNAPFATIPDRYSYTPGRRVRPPSSAPDTRTGRAGTATSPNVIESPLSLDRFQYSPWPNISARSSSVMSGAEVNTARGCRRSRRLSAISGANRSPSAVNDRLEIEPNAPRHAPEPDGAERRLPVTKQGASKSGTASPYFAGTRRFSSSCQCSTTIIRDCESSLIAISPGFMIRKRLSGARSHCPLDLADV